MAVLDGFGGRDNLYGTEARDRISGLGGIDVLFGYGGNDVLKGGTGDDILYGGDGNDVLRGGSGADELYGDQGRDVLDGGTGAGLFGRDLDLVDYSFNFNAGIGLAVRVDLSAGTAFDPWGMKDRLIDIEAVYGTPLADTLTGGNVANDDFETFRGYAGNDTIDGGTGFDRADYARDADMNGYLYIIADLAAGTVRDGFGDIDTIRNIEAIRASIRADNLFGDDMDNSFEPLSGFDYIDGRGGRDEVSYANEHAFTGRNGGITGIRADLREGVARDTTGRETDTLVSIEDVHGSIFDDDIRGDGGANRLRGHDGDDFIAGRRGNDDLQGESGQDFLFGGRGGDLLAGGSGNDTMRGGAGADTFVLAPGDDFDRIRDFGNGADRLDVSAFGFAAAADVLALARQTGGSVIIRLSDDDAVILDDFSLADLGAGDFLL